MKDYASQSDLDAPWRSKYNASQSELREKEKHWQDTEKLLCLLVSRMAMRVDCPDSTLANNLKVLLKALREGCGLLDLRKQIKDIADRILQLEDSEFKSSPSGNGAEGDDLTMIQDVFIVLLDNINIPSAYSDRIDRIKLSLQSGQDGKGMQIVSGLTSLAEVLDDIFYSVKHDKQKFGQFLQQINSDLRSLDLGITVADELHIQKEHATASIDSKLATEMQEMENVITTQPDIEKIKHSVQSSVNTIRNHMEKFRLQEQQRNEQSKSTTEGLRRQLNKMEQQCTELKKQVLKKHQQTLSDSLTGIRNRLAYEEAIQMECDRFKRYGRPLALIIFDLDNFKHVNDNYGHTVGDKVLQSVAKTLATNIRNVDFLARYGGEEFAVILPELELKDARLVAQKILNAVQAENLNIDGQTIRMTISAGVARMRPDDTVDSLFERADTALYLAKERGRNRCETE